MFKQVFVEKTILDHPRTQGILNWTKKTPLLIDKVEDVFGRVHKPIEEKRENLSLFIGKKRGELVKVAPQAYGYKRNERHFYFIHAYNCIYDCRYCYLQGYFSSPDLVLFINHEDIIADMEKTLVQFPGEPVWFHAGEFSDSLAISPYTQEWPLYWNFFKNHSNAILELRTKSNLVDTIIDLEPLKNIVVSFSLNPEAIVHSYERRTPSLSHRLAALIRLCKEGFIIGIHLDPIIYTPEFESNYRTLVAELAKLPHTVKNNLIKYISLGTMRFNRDFFKQNPGLSNLVSEEMHIGFDKKIRYQRPLRLYMSKFLEQELLTAGFAKEKIYYCMEEEPDSTRK